MDIDRVPRTRTRSGSGAAAEAPAAPAPAPSAAPRLSYAALAARAAPAAPPAAAVRAPAAAAAAAVAAVGAGADFTAPAVGVAHFSGGGASAAGGAAGGAAKPVFPAASAAALAAAAPASDEVRSVRVPPHRFTPLKEQWDALIKPLTGHMRLQVRMNVKTRAVELKAGAGSAAGGRAGDAGALQKGEDYVRAFMLGFDLADAVALLRLDDLYIETFEVTDVKPLKGDHLGRAIGRIAGIGGKTRFAIENATRTRIVVADVKVHILGAFSNIQIARDAVCALILGSPPGKVYASMRTVASRIAAKH